MEALTKIKHGRPKLPPDEKMEVFTVQVPKFIRKDLNALSVRCDKSVSQLAREALALIVIVYGKDSVNACSKI